MDTKSAKAVSTFFIFITFINLFDCSSRVEKDKLIVEQFAEIYTRLLTLVSDSTVSDTNHLEIVLDSLQIRKNEYEANLLFLQENPELWLEVITTVNKNLERNTLDNPARTSTVGSISPK